MAKAAQPARTTEAAGTASPIDRLIIAMANIVEDGTRSVRIKHLFIRKTDTDLQISLDMHDPVE
jgi:hypothetical protein